jgi:hypothetical protein
LKTVQIPIDRQGKSSARVRRGIPRGYYEGQVRRLLSDSVKKERLYREISYYIGLNEYQFLILKPVSQSSVMVQILYSKYKHKSYVPLIDWSVKEVSLHRRGVCRWPEPFDFDKSKVSTLSTDLFPLYFVSAYVFLLLKRNESESGSVKVLVYLTIFFCLFDHTYIASRPLFFYFF